MTQYAPTSEAEVVEAVQTARAAKSPLRIVGGGTRSGYGRPVEAASVLSLANLTGITLYEPAEMVIGARAGTPLREIEAALAANRQMLPFEPGDFRALYGTAGAPSIGAIAAGNFSGPRRISAGATRDSLIGVRFVNGRGAAIKSGGRVMKNVTGLDLVKLQAGALGTLGPLTEVIFKVLPCPETSLTLVLSGLDDARAIAALSAGLTTPFEVSGAAHLLAGQGMPARTCLRLEGFAESLRYRAGALQAILKPFGPASVVEGAASEDLWRRIGEPAHVASSPDETVWRISLKPTDGPAFVAALARATPIRHHLYDWGGGLVWLALAPGPDGGAAAVRAALGGFGGHATLVRAAPEVRASVSVFQPESPPLALLADGIRRSVDPDGLFNPRLMHG